MKRCAEQCALQLYQTSLSDVVILVMWPKWVRKHFQEVKKLANFCILLTKIILHWFWRWRCKDHFNHMYQCGNFQNREAYIWWWPFRVVLRKRFSVNFWKIPTSISALECTFCKVTGWETANSQKLSSIMNISLECFEIYLISIVDQLDQAAPALVERSSRLAIPCYTAEVS